MDDKLNLGPENFSPELVKKVVRNGGKEAFASAVGQLREDLSLELTGKDTQRVTERIGTEWTALRDQDVESFKQGKLVRLYANAPKCAVMMADGGRLLTRMEDQPPGVHHPKWCEPKYGCALTLNTEQVAVDPMPEPPSKFLNIESVKKLVQQMQNRTGVSKDTNPKHVKVSSATKQKRRLKKKKRLSARLLRTAVATMRSSIEFGYMLAAEAYKRNLDQAQRKAYVCDGQAYNWTIWEEHFPNWVAILDFLHLLVYLYGAAQAAGGGILIQAQRYQKWVRLAWSGEREKLLTQISIAANELGAPPKNAPEHDARSVLKKAVGYVTNNLERMDYPRYRKLGLPTSSAPVESLIKQFNRRVKGTEKFWTKNGAEAVLQVCAAYLSEDGRTERYWATPRPRYRAVGRNRLKFAS